MRITLVFAGIGRGGWNCIEKAKTNPNFGDEETYVPIGLALLTAVLKQKGHEVVPLDMRRCIGWDDFVRKAIESEATVFGFGPMSMDYPRTLTAAKLVKAAMPGVRLIIGGVHASLMTDDVRKDAEWDAILTGEAEATLPNIVGLMERGQTLPARVVPHTYMPTVDIDALPVPDRDAWGWADSEATHPWANIVRTPFVSMVTSRGCPGRCRFCKPASNILTGGKVRIRSLDSVFTEFNWLRDHYDFHGCMFFDDLCFCTAKRGLDFSARYKAEGFDVDLVLLARVDITAKHPEMFEALARDAKLKMAVIGFESNSQRTLDMIRKDTTVEQNEETVRICKKNGVAIMANIMFGFPGEMQDDIMATVDFVRRMRPTIFSPTYFTPTPGSYLYDECKAKGLIISDDLRHTRREVNVPKIRGVDYDFIRGAINGLCADLASGGQS